MDTTPARRVLAIAGGQVTAFLFALVLCAGASLWLPEGSAGIDHIVLAVVTFPLVWVACSIWIHAHPKRSLAWGVPSALVAVHLALIAWRIAQT